jgi:hypothetical protein
MTILGSEGEEKGGWKQPASSTICHLPDRYIR